MDEESLQAIEICQGKLITEALVEHQMLTLVFEDKTRLSVWDNHPFARGLRALIAPPDTWSVLVNEHFRSIVMSDAVNNHLVVIYITAGTLTATGLFINDAYAEYPLDIIARAWTKERLNVPQ